MENRLDPFKTWEETHSTTNNRSIMEPTFVSNYDLVISDCEIENAAFIIKERSESLLVKFATYNKIIEYILANVINDKLISGIIREYSNYTNEVAKLLIEFTNSATNNYKSFINLIDDADKSLY